MEVQERFLKYILKTDSCWLWTASLSKYGYGQFYYKGKLWRAHRVAYDLFVGSIPFGFNVLHKCDIRNCVKPEHLFLGTQKNNIDDMITKGRGVNPIGEHHGMSKLTEDQVLNILADYVKGSGPKLAKKYGVSRWTITKIVKRKEWKYLL